MSASNDGAQLDALTDQLAALTDLFRRRLLDDRTKQARIEDLQARLESAERKLAAESLRPLVTRISLVIERLMSMPPSTELSTSIVDELEDILLAFGVRSIGLGHEIDSRRHEIVSVHGEGTVLRPEELVRSGYEKDGVVLVPARVKAARVAGGGDPDAPPVPPGDLRW